jgi:hypothetical protein
LNEYLDKRNEQILHGIVVELGIDDESRDDDELGMRMNLPLTKNWGLAMNSPLTKSRGLTKNRG